jgi:hypothetical protein
MNLLQFSPLVLGALLLPRVLPAQSLVNTGAVVYVGAGATLYTAGALDNQAGTLRNEGTVRTGGHLSNAGTLDLGAGTWQALGNFTSTGPVVAGTGTLAFVGAADQSLAVAGATLPAVLVAQTGTGTRLLVPTDATLAGGLSLQNGLVRTAATATLTLPDGAALTGEAAGRYVQGNLRVLRSSVAGVVDFGHGVVLDGTGQNLGAVSVTRTAGLRTAGTSYGTNVGGGSQGIDRIWTIVPARQPTAPVPLTLGWLADDDNGLTSFATARLWTQASPADSWRALGAAADASTTRRLSGSAAQLARFTVSNAANPLPVELIRFEAERRGADAWLRWTTAQEKNNAGFEVEVSLDGQRFSRIGWVAGQGNSTVRHDYDYRDPLISRYGAEVLYYRLRQVDADGAAQVSPVRAVRVPAVAELTVQAWPNPMSTEALQLTVHTSTAGPAVLSIHDAVGRTLLSRPLEALPKGSSRLDWPAAAQLPPGVYLLRLQQGNQRATLKLVRSE